MPPTDSTGKDLAQMILDIGAHPGRYASNENENMRKDGTRVWVAWTNKPILDDQGRCVEILCIGNDITERRRMEEALRESEVLLRSVVTTSPLGITLETAERVIVWANDAMARNSGYNSKDLEGRSTRMFYASDEEFARVGEIIHNEVAHGGISVTETKFLCRDGQIRDVQLTAAPVDGKDASAGMVFVIADITERKRTETALQESEEKFRLLFERSADPILLMDGDTFVDCNEAAIRLMGYSSKEQLIGLRPWDISPERQPDGRLSSEKGKELISETTRRGINRFEWMRRTLDGEEFWVEVSHTVIPTQGRLLMYTMWRDIRERKHAEAELRESEERYRVAIESSNDGVALFRGPGLIYGNRRYFDMFGYDSLEEAQHVDRFLVVHPDDRERLREYTARRLRGEPAPSSYECKAIGKNGAIMHLEVSVARVTYRGEPTSLAYLRDITERKRTEEALLQSEKKYRSIFDNAIEGIFQTTPDGRYLTVNPALAHMYGYDSPEEMMETVTDLQEQQYVVPEDRVRLKALYRQQGFVKNFETQLYTKSRDKVWISMNAHAVTDPEGNTLYYEGTAENVTERKSLQVQLLQAQKMEAIGTLAGGVAHDFNNILMALMGYANLLQMKMGQNDPSRVYVDQILASTAKAANITQSLLAFGRKQIMEMKPHKISTIVKDVEKLLRRLMPEDIELTIKLGDDATVKADMTQIDQVLINLATNARDAMPKGGKLTIETGRVVIDEEFMRTYGYGKPDAYALIMVTDTGMGMDEKTQEKLFEPFFTTKEPGKGTGLGLSIVYGIIKQHNGYINVSSRIGEGSTFLLYLPEVKEKPREARSTFREAKGGKEALLLAEDNADIRAVMSGILKMSGYTVIDAVNGRDAVEKFREHKDEIRLIILDVVMPEKNGKEAYEEMRTMKQDVKALFMSGYTADVVLDKGVFGKTLEYMAKPIAPNELLHKVRNLLDG